MKKVDLIYQTMLAELEQRCLDAEFDEQFAETGLFKKVRVKSKEYWYFHERIDGRDRMRYVGPVSDEEITRRVETFKQIKGDFKARRKLVSTLVRDAGLPAIDRETGDLVEAFWKAGLFRLRVVIVGTVAYRCYAGILGIRLRVEQMQTGDVDFAQFHAISASVDDSIAPVLDILRSVDPTFREISSQLDGRQATKFVNGAGFKVEFLTPNTSKDDYQGKPAHMPALGGAAAQPLRFLDYVITDPIRSVLLHKGGIPVWIPSPQRFAVHKLIVAARRMVDGQSVTKSAKDIEQASSIIEALSETRRHMDLASAWTGAWDRGDAWRKALTQGRSMLKPEIHDVLVDSLRRGASEAGEPIGI